MFVAYTRCGNDSGQCVRIVDRCNDITDCENGWDELESNCWTAKDRQLFVNDCTYLKSQKAKILANARQS